MKILISLIALFLSMSAAAQTGFADRIQKDVEGEGSVRLIQDSRLTALVNGNGVPTVQRDNSPGDGRGVVKVKRRGYRIQVFQGGNTRVDKAAAQRVGEQVSEKFDLIPYTLYNNPEWVCRVGDFRTREEAAEYLQRVKVVFTGAMIVPSEIYVEK